MIRRYNCGSMSDQVIACYYMRRHSLDPDRTAIPEPARDRLGADFRAFLRHHHRQWVTSESIESTLSAA